MEFIFGCLISLIYGNENVRCYLNFILNTVSRDEIQEKNSWKRFMSINK